MPISLQNYRKFNSYPHSGFQHFSETQIDQ